MAHMTESNIKKVILDFFSFNKERGGGGCNPKKTERYLKFQIWDWFFSVFFGFFVFFFGFSILANFDWFNGFLLSGSFC